jgi:hypothetical protein
MAEHNRVQTNAINLCKGQIEQIEAEREKIQGGDLVSMRNQKDTLKELAELQHIAERRKTKCERELHSYYVPDPGHSHKHSFKDSSSKSIYLIPMGLEKGRGSELATKATLWSKSNIEQTSAIHRYIMKAVKSFDSEKGLFWKSPLKSEVSTIVPSLEQQAYNRQNQWLWDQMVSGHCNAETIRLILRPTKRGYYSDIPVIGEEGNGVLALWVLMMHYRKCNEAYCLSPTRRVARCNRTEQNRTQQY